MFYPLLSLHYKSYELTKYALAVIILFSRSYMNDGHAPTIITLIKISLHIFFNSLL